MEVIFPDWSGPHPHAADPRGTMLAPFPRALPVLAPGQRIVLDSGAFGRAFTPAAERQDTAAWMLALRDWYRAAQATYGAALRWVVAPDVFGDPRATWQQWQDWCDLAPDVPAAPVIQLWPRKPLDLHTIQQQARAYGPQRVVMLSNPARMTAAKWGRTLGDACDIIRRYCGADCHIHLLGAGWHLTDIAMYRQVPNLDSIDSITYYLAAQRGERWCKCCTATTPWPAAAFHHARVASLG
jgi:hypothetical protein